MLLLLGREQGTPKRLNTSSLCEEVTILLHGDLENLWRVYMRADNVSFSWARIPFATALPSAASELHRLLGGADLMAI